MNTGKDFELKALEALTHALNTNSLGLLPDSCKIFHRKGYYSRDRRSEIVTDISIELYLPGASTWSILWVWECKDYQTRIPVDDVEEFWAKLNQIGGANVKGGIVTSGVLQAGALNYAKSKGIAVVRLLPDNQITHILARSRPGPQLSPAEIAQRELERATRALTEPEFVSDRKEFFALYVDAAVSTWNKLVDRVLGEADEVREIGGLFVHRIEDIFNKPGAQIICGTVLLGKIVPGESVTLLGKNAKYVATVTGIENFGVPKKEATAGDHACLLFSDLPQGVITPDFLIANERAISLLELE